MDNLYRAICTVTSEDDGWSRVVQLPALYVGPEQCCSDSTAAARVVRSIAASLGFSGILYVAIVKVDATGWGIDHTFSSHTFPIP